MREIKFRAWDNLAKKMCDDFLYFVEDAVYQHQANPWRDTRFIPMQYTGLKDTSGKEIYDGDLMQFGPTERSTVGPYTPLAEEGTISPVVYKEGKFQLEEADLYDCLRWHEMEVVGNIYENPELLAK
jgi:uncharacterized phage protein (TIGR01671 family)